MAPSALEEIKRIFPVGTRVYVFQRQCHMSIHDYTSYTVLLWNNANASQVTATMLSGEPYWYNMCTDTVRTPAVHGAHVHYMSLYYLCDSLKVHRIGW